MTLATDSNSPLGPQELHALVERIVDSGVLGKSKTYANILRYLATCSIEGSSPKEISIAIDVLQRDAQFDISRDSIVRVHVYHLRNKLQRYFEKHGQEERFRIYIPKGQYDLAIVPRDDGQASGLVQGEVQNDVHEDVADDVFPDPEQNGTLELRRRFPSRPVLLVLLLLALLGNAWQGWKGRDTTSPAEASQPLAEFRFWSNLLDDGMPVLVIVGDYYIFGEAGAAGQIDRLVRDFNVNSPQDLRRLQAGGHEASARYVDLNLSYAPTAVSDALAFILPVLKQRERRVLVKTMSELHTADLASHHIVYLGLLSGLAQLHDLMFADSGLYIGATYDELYTIDGDDYFFTNNQFNTSGTFLDYGLLSIFTGPRGNQFLMLAGMRDTGLANVAEQVVNPLALRALGDELGLAPGAMGSLEALYRVTGMDGTSFDAQRVYSQPLESAVIWEVRLVGQGGQYSAKP